MQHFWSLDKVLLHNTWLTIGSFDGVHLGHQKIIREITAGAHQAGAPAVVLTFHPRPAVVIRGISGAVNLTMPDERAAVLESLEVDYLITYPFNKQVAATSARDFMQDLVNHLHIQQLWVGYDFALGRNREGDIDKLRQLGETFDYQLHVVTEVTINGEVISSSRIRQLLALGDVEQVIPMMGRPYQVTGTIVPGDQRGRMIGIPTANLQVAWEKIVPASGVYVCWARLGERRYAAAVNIGIRPTFDGSGSDQHVEAHLLDFQADLYGQVLTLEFIERLRGEVRFPDVQTLIDQIHQDIDRTRQILTKPPK